MDEQTLYASGLVSEINCIVTDAANIIGQYNVATATMEPNEAGDWSGMSGLQSPDYIPTSIADFKIIYWNSGASQVNDVFQLKFWDLGSVGWQNFTGATVLEESETEYDSAIWLNDLNTLFGLYGGDKIDWLNALTIGWDMDVIKADDGIVIATQGIELKYNYTPAAGGPRGPLGHPLTGPFGGPI